MDPTGPTVLCDQNGVELADIETDHTIRFERSRAASVKFSLGYDQPAARELLATLASARPQLRAYRRVDANAAAVIFSGWWQPQQETAADSTSDAIASEFRSPFSLLEGRYLTADVTFTAQDAGTGIAWPLIAATNGVSPTGLVEGTIETTVTRDRSYQTGQQLADLIQQLTDVENGFVFTETMLDPLQNGGALAAFNVWANLGRDLSTIARFEYGDQTLANVLSVQRTVSPPVNQAIVTGGTGTTPAIANDAGSQAIWGVCAQTATFSDVTVQSALDDKAAGMLQPDPVQQVTFQPDLDDDLRPIDDYWLGDTIGFRADAEALQIDTTAEVNAIEIDRDGAGRELAYRVEFGAQAVQPLTVVRRGRKITFRDPVRV